MNTPTSQVIADPSLPKARVAYGYLAFFVILNYLNIVDRNLLAAFAPSIVEELQLSDTQYGLLSGLIFVTVYAVTGLFMGAMADRFHRPRIIAVGLTLWSTLTAITGLTQSFIQITFARMFIGVGESALSPTAISILSDLFPPQKRGMATGIYYFGVPIGAGSSYLIAGELGPIIGWRNCFLLLGCLGLVFVIGLLFLKDPKRGVMDKGNKSSLIALEKFSFRNALRDVGFSLKTSPALVFTIIAGVAMAFPVGAGAMEMLWLVRERGYSEADIASKFGLIFMLCGTFAAFFGAFGSDWFCARFRSGRIGFLLICLVLMAPILMTYRFLEPDTPLFFLCMAITFIYVSFSYGPIFATVQELSPVPYRGTLLGFYLLVSNIIGGGGGAGMVGMLSDYLREQGIENALSLGLFSAGLVTTIAIPCLILAIKHYQKDLETLHNLDLSNIKRSI
jgi:MFS family permease